MSAFSFPRRQQPGECRAAASGSAAILAGALAVTAAGVGATALAGLLALVMAALLLDARRWVRLAARGRVGGRDLKTRCVARSAGWRRRDGGCGTRSSVAGAGISTASPSRRPGVAFAIETKTRTFDERHRAHARETAVWLRRRQRRWCRRGAFPVLCVVRARRLKAIEDGVLVVSPDRLVSALRAGAGTSGRPGLLATQSSPN